ncbi:hypothetical protein L249_0255 [Ophiocordyceps polyrhachis-furcata BCC 54312]|uniref:Uncharacterized protein n=1 Tax=Ophiocordyceps polyrhachis-furcata BCC 54312 TaxID=1330021 RepID=A0A367LCV9_9HYPO|nr:hypothetical protein L249_0255 [Ophiocordyceps polyrhachis-furcata BCC 54312]
MSSCFPPSVESPTAERLKMRLLKRGKKRSTAGDPGKNPKRVLESMSDSPVSLSPIDLEMRLLKRKGERDRWHEKLVLPPPCCVVFGGRGVARQRLRNLKRKGREAFAVERWLKSESWLPRQLDPKPPTAKTCAAGDRGDKTGKLLKREQQERSSPVAEAHSRLSGRLLKRRPGFVKSSFEMQSRTAVADKALVNENEKAKAWIRVEKKKNPQEILVPASVVHRLIELVPFSKVNCIVVPDRKSELSVLHLPVSPFRLRKAWTKKPLAICCKKCGVVVKRGRSGHESASYDRLLVPHLQTEKRVVPKKKR